MAGLASACMRRVRRSSVSSLAEPAETSPSGDSLRPSGIGTGVPGPPSLPPLALAGDRAGRCGGLGDVEGVEESLESGSGPERTMAVLLRCVPTCVCVAEV